MAAITYKCPNCDGGYITPRGKDEALCGRCGAIFVTGCVPKVKEKPSIAPGLREIDYCDT